MSTMTAKYHGSCSDGCGARIQPGDEIVADGTGEFILAEHGSIELSMGPARADLFDRPLGKVCPECNLELPVSGVCC